MSENCSKDENERIKMEDQTISKNIYFSNQTISVLIINNTIHNIYYIYIYIYIFNYILIIIY